MAWGQGYGGPVGVATTITVIKPSWSRYRWCAGHLLKLAFAATFGADSGISNGLGGSMGDAILAKIEKCRAAWTSLSNVSSCEPNELQSPAHEQWEGLQNKIGSEWGAAFWDMLMTTPTTRQGAVALIDAFLMSEGEAMNRELCFELLARLRGFLQSAAVWSFLMVIPSAAVLSGCAANQQTASTAISPQEEQDRSVCLQHAHKDSGYNEKMFASCMMAKGYKKDNLYPSETTADAGKPLLSDTLSDTFKKFAQSASPDNAAGQTDSENAEQISH